MEFGIKIEQAYLGIPIQAEQPEELLEIFLGDKKLYEFRVPVCRDSEKINYYSYLNLKQYGGQELTLKGNFDPAFFAGICQKEDCTREPLKRPLLHFTAERGWINDPNGLVYHNGTYHLFFQYNPMNTQWQNMSWGHSVSGDLLHFRQVETAMYPDEYGAIYSGCGIVNERGLLGLPEDALLFYYSAAGNINQWSQGRIFDQRIAYSLDEGNTLIKMPEPAVGPIEEDSRDPKVFWHEETQAYIMVLWIRGNEFGIFRSQNLQDWEKTSSIDLPEAWECPDLFPLQCGGETVWVFTSADGFYWLGRFDGYVFHTDGIQKKAYMTRLPYAAQTYSGVEGRIISVPWLRTVNTGRMYTGMMGLPRELGLVKCGEEQLLSMLPVREYEETKREIAEFAWGDSDFELEITEEAVTEIELHPRREGRISVRFFGQELTIGDNAVFYRGERTVFAEKLEEVHILIDREVLEIYVNHGTGNAYYETGADELQGKIQVKGCSGMGKVYIWQP